VLLTFALRWGTSRSLLVMSAAGVALTLAMNLI
jgi:hypothetical protein